MTTFRCRLLAVGSFTLFLAACDTDYWQYTSACRDGDWNTVCPVDGSRDGRRPTSNVAGKHTRVPKETPERLALALAELRKAAVLEQQNPDAWRAAYLNKRYRVVGKVGSITGTIQSESDTTMFGYSGPVFRIELEPWDIRSSGPEALNYSAVGPSLAFVNLPQSTRVAMRPGQLIDANCTLTKRMTFAYCQLNRAPHK